MIYYLNCILIFLALVFLSILCSCTCNISMAHTDGPASDVIDDNQTTAPQLSTPVNYRLL